MIHNPICPIPTAKDLRSRGGLLKDRGCISQQKGLYILDQRTDWSIVGRLVTAPLDPSNAKNNRCRGSQFGTRSRIQVFDQALDQPNRRRSISIPSLQLILIFINQPRNPSILYRSDFRISGSYYMPSMIVSTVVSGRLFDDIPLLTSYCTTTIILPLMTTKKHEQTVQKIEVAIRMRPILSQFEDEPAWVIDPAANSIASINRQHSFDKTPKKRYVEVFCNYRYNFDHVFGLETTTHDIYDRCCLQLINGFLDGENSTIFMYGQTTSGKTYTMLGDKSCEGLIIFSLKDIFKRFPKTNLANKYRINISYLEIYNQQINDLLSPGSLNLKIQQDSVQGLKQCPAECFEQARELLVRGEQQRSYKQKNMHDHSSRSHTIFQIRVSDIVSGRTRCCLNLVDLAGSERLTDEDRLNDTTQETGYINKSLFVLSNVISKLAKSTKKTHIPFRDSKLTRLLSNSLVGKSNTMIICTVSPAAMNFYQTLSTLRFATNAKKVERQVTVCEDSFDKENKEKDVTNKQAREMKEEILRLRKQLKLSQKRQEVFRLQIEQTFSSTKNASSVLTKDTRGNGTGEEEFLTRLKEQIEEKMGALPVSWVRKSSDLCAQYTKNIDILQYKYKMALFNIAESESCPTETQLQEEVIKQKSSAEILERIKSKDIFNGLTVSALLNSDCEVQDVSHSEVSHVYGQAKEVLTERFIQLKQYLQRRQLGNLMPCLQSQFQQKMSIIERAYSNVCRNRRFP